MFDSQETLRTYQAAPGNHRGFCNNCGSYLFFRREKSSFINLAVGCFDKDALEKFGTALTKASTHLYVRNEIPEVTDHLVEGERIDTE